MQDPFSERLFCIINRHRSSINILYWECNGFCLWKKEIGARALQVATPSEWGIITLDEQQLNWLRVSRRRTDDENAKLAT